MIPVYLISYNRLDWLKGMCEWLLRIPSVVPTVIDNASTYPPLLDWLERPPVQVIRLSENVGKYAVWRSGTVPLGPRHRSFYGSEFYAVSDPNLDLTGCPPDLFEVLEEGLRRYPCALKCGPSLEYTDLPDHFPLKNEVVEWESGHWGDRLDDAFFSAPLDTTLALYHCDRAFEQHRWLKPSLRADRPYTARHIPWYSDPLKPTPEDAHYHRRSGVYGHWSGLVGRTILQNAPSSPFKLFV